MQLHSPLIVTLAIDKESQAFFDRLRDKYFPPAINFIAAHLTLFHHLPADELSVLKDLNELINQQLVLLLEVTGVVSIGNGVAYKIDCPPLVLLHQRMQQKWKAWLTPQDKQKLWPHITIQNKVAPATAKETLLQLKENFQHFTIRATGFSLWSYEGGPWKFIKELPFMH
jgi:hypothetical protein